MLTLSYCLTFKEKIMIKLKNTVENEIIGSFENQIDFIEKIKLIAKENDDNDIIISSTYHAIAYVNDFCANLEVFIDKNTMKTESYLCKCLNCDNVLFDENPQINAEKHLIKGNELHMIVIKDDEEYYFGCPICNTDSFLSDFN